MRKHYVIATELYATTVGSGNRHTIGSKFACVVDNISRGISEISEVTVIVIAFCFPCECLIGRHSRLAVACESVTVESIAPIDFFGFVIVASHPTVAMAFPQNTLVGINCNRIVSSFDCGEHKIVAIGKILATDVIGVGERHIGT